MCAIPTGNHHIPVLQFVVVTCYLPIILVPLSVSFFFLRLFYLFPPAKHAIPSPSNSRPPSHVVYGALSVITKRYIHTYTLIAVLHVLVVGFACQFDFCSISAPPSPRRFVECMFRSRSFGLCGLVHCYVLICYAPRDVSSFLSVFVRLPPPPSSPHLPQCLFPCHCYVQQHQRSCSQ